MLLVVLLNTGTCFGGVKVTIIEAFPICLKLKENSVVDVLFSTCSSTNIYRIDGTVLARNKRFLFVSWES